uniref:Uncharacterized protein n=1 Tax=Lygus hesperus TaxID=30085 RepID=A0A0A9ZAN6_LYGHE
MKEGTGLGRASMPKEPLNVGENAADLHQTIPTNIDNQKRGSINSLVFNDQQNIETLDPLRNLRNSRSFVGDVSLPPRARMSFKDFEIKPDSIVANESLSTVGLDDSGILKAGLNDMTCPERVPCVSMSMTSNITSPCSKSRMSLADRTTFSSSPTHDVHQNCEQTTLTKSFQPASYQPALGKPREDQPVNRLETHDDQDTSVSVPFVFKHLPEKKKSDAHKLGQSFPIIEFDESPNRSGVVLQRTSMGINHIPAVNKSVDPNQFVSDQDTSISMPFVFKAVTDKRGSDDYQLRQSFPIIECGESQSSAQMEFTEVTPSVDIAPRKSLARINSDIDGNSIQPSYSSGQMELTDVVAVNRKSIRSSELTSSPQDSSAIEMDETLMKIKAPDEDKAREMFLNATGNTEGLTTTTCDMEETNVKQKIFGNPRKSFFPSAESPLSLTSEETITRPNSSNVAHTAEPISESCAVIDDEETLAKLSLNLDVSGKEQAGSGAVDTDMERIAVNPQIRLSLAPNNRKSFFYSQMSPDRGAAHEVLNANHDVHANVMPELDQPKVEYCNDRTNNVEELPDSAVIAATSGDVNATSDLEQFLKVGLDNPDELKSTIVKRHSDLAAVDKSLDVFPAIPCRKSGSGRAADAQPEDDYCIEQVIVENSIGTVAKGISLDVTNFAVRTVSTEVDIPANAIADYQGELKSSNENKSSVLFSSGARLSCRKSGLGNATYAQPDNDSRAEPLVVEKSIETAAMRISSGNTNLTVQNDDALTNDLTEVDIPLNVPQNASPSAQLACRKSDFGMFVGSQPQDEVCDERGNIVQLSPQRTAMETSVGAKPESNAPLDMLESASFHEHVDRGVSKTDMRLFRKSVHFLNSSRKEDNDARCYSMNESHEEKFEVDLAPSNECVEMKLNSNFETEVSECPLPRRPSRKSCIGIPVDTDKDVEGKSKQTTNSDDNSGEFEFAIRRTKRKSTIGTRQSENYPDFDPRGPEDYDKMNITPLDGQLYESDMVPASESADTEPQEAAEDIDLSQDLMNISLNDGELSESEAGKLNATSTPCKPRASCSTEPPYPDRKRNRSGTAKTPSLASDLAHDLSQEMMNISIQSDTRSPLPKKSFVEPLRKSIGRTLESRESSIGLNIQKPDPILTTSKFQKILI